MTYQEKLAFLRRYREAVQQEDTILQEIEALRCQAARVTQALTGMPGGGDGQALPRAVEQILEAQEKLQAQAARTAESRTQVAAVIYGVDDPLRRGILTRGYILGQRWRRIAGDRGFTLRRVLQLHRSAVEGIDLG